MIKLVMTKKQEIVLCIILLIIAAIAVIQYIGIGRTPEPAAEPTPKPELSVSERINNYMEKCDAIEESFLEKLESGGYDINNPLVIVNPYETSPLTALVIFKTEQPVYTSVQIIGKTEETSIKHSFNTPNIDHIIPIYGLYPGKTNIVTIELKPGSASAARGNMQEQTMTLMIETDKISDKLPDNLILSDRKVQDNPGTTAQSGFYFSYQPMYAFDRNGDCRWYYDSFFTIYPTVYTDGNQLKLIVGTFEENNALLLDVNMLGRVVSATPIDEDYEIKGYNNGHLELREFYTGQ